MTVVNDHNIKVKYVYTYITYKFEVFKECNRITLYNEYMYMYMEVYWNNKL